MLNIVKAFGVLNFIMAVMIGICVLFMLAIIFVGLCYLFGF